MTTATPNRVSLVLATLLDIAIKPIEPGGAIIAGVEPRRGSDVCFSVTQIRDPHPFPDLPHAFSIASGAPRTRPAGSRPRIVDCQGDLEAHGGRIWVESLPPRTGLSTA